MQRIPEDYCQMLGTDKEAFSKLLPVLRALTTKDGFL